MKDVSFLRIDGLNAAGETLTVYGDFSCGMTVDELSGLSWEKSNSYSGDYVGIADAHGATYTPRDGGYYLRVSAAHGEKTLTSYPVFIREKAENGFFKAYLSEKDGVLTAAVVYNNEKTEYIASATVTACDGDEKLASFSKSFSVNKGSDVAWLEFSEPALRGRRVELEVICDGRTICSASSISEGLPFIEINTDEGGTEVSANGEQIAFFRQNRYMKFRPSIENDHWIGTDHDPVDMGFAYQEKPLAGVRNNRVESVALPGVFKVVLIGEKETVKAEQRNELIGFFDAETCEFSFIYNASMTADTAAWHEKSKWALQNRIEPFDYHLERMSILDRVFNKNHGGDLYDYVIYENGDELVRIPKLPVPRFMLKGKYFYGFFLSPGESMYFPDSREGGWAATLLSAVGDTYIEICWSWYDIHNCAENSVPRLGHSDEFTVSQSWLYTPTAAEADRVLSDRATEIEWRELPNYQLPLFSTRNTFETQFGSTNWQYAWWKSSYDCTMDAEVGHDGAGSVKIEKDTLGEASWYTEGVWGFPYSFDEVQGKRCRFSGYIKTENVVGEAYIADLQYAHPTPHQQTVYRSESVSGTSDWTYVSFTFTAQERVQDGNVQRCIDHFFLTLNGSGKVWFDDVVIEELE